MSLQKAFVAEYLKAKTRGYDRIYYALDLHGTCIKSNYEQNSYNWINEHCLPCLLALSALPETKLIIWSSLHKDEIPNVVRFFETNGVKIFAVNNNPAEKNTTTGCFDDKFYVSIILDDKAGFDPEEWPEVVEWVYAARTLHALQPTEAVEVV